MLVMAEVGSAFTQEGGPYEWVKLAFGRFHGGIAAVLYWVTNPLWVGGSLAFIATDAWRANVFDIGHGTVGDYIFKLVFIWISIGVAIVSLQHGKWIPNVGAICASSCSASSRSPSIIYAIKHGVARLLGQRHVADARRLPRRSCRCCSSTTSASSCRTAPPRRWTNPQRDVPISVLRSGIAGVLLYVDPDLRRSSSCCRPSKITGIGGFIDAVTTVFSVYGGAAHASARSFMTICFVGTLVTSGAVWMIGSDRIQAVAAYDGAFFPFFGVFNASSARRCASTSCRGSSSSIFCIVAIAALQRGANATFEVVLDIAISTTLISYLWIFPAALKLRYTHPHVHRPYRVPGGHAGPLDRRDADHGLDRARLLGRGLPRHARAPVRRRLRLQGHVGRHAARRSRR